MRAVVQRVSRARVDVEDLTVGEIGMGLCVLLGVERGDGEADLAYVFDKIVNLRIFEDDEGKMNRSLLEVGGALLVVSQFTLLGDVRKGRRPSFVAAEEPGRANELYEQFLARAREMSIETAGGVFQAMMDVTLTNQGPVTFIVDSKKRF
ncbi:MAG: D-tyrosyl-tRNA(Tyr) deacylase [Deltaproteobacteria bacterium]|nr:D-tyrosyl-tRNA(Tyr) deacylase [Candidatus Zymogenaceae bacterium]